MPAVGSHLFAKEQNEKRLQDHNNSVNRILHTHQHIELIHKRDELIKLLAKRQAK